MSLLSMNFFSMAAKGGFLMIVLLGLSIAALYIIGQKIWLLYKINEIGDGFMDEVRQLLAQGRIEEAAQICRRYDSPLARLVLKGIERKGRPADDIQVAVENEGNAEIAKLEKWLPMLATIAGGAPMIGFLGTVLGMIQAFFNMSTAGSNVDINLLSSGIYTAMVTTVGGLVVGIIAYFGYNYLTSAITTLVHKMENITVDLTETLSKQ
ncbi:MAG: MotA/TolQ/ExbB proton channel family protein [Bacteroidales bacterium]|nr:MotA/TolQ/ExbB proton channel family protein [Bacteroidales bacterium]MBR0297960.1 MotA/TolQ/ExbB proton channel family protein [Bacteroidales bacterium]